VGRTYDTIEPQIREWIGRQHVFFVATAPSDDDGHVNVSPKGLDTFRVLDPLTVAYLDLTGSGIETVAHLRENGRITFMFCAFDGPPRIVRIYGRGEVLVPDDPDWDDLAAPFPPIVGTRSVIRVRVDRVSDSCGYAVPRYDYIGDRDRLLDWAEQKGSLGITTYRSEKNARSIDGLPGLPGMA
jgi:predicted pyridoxine 5'-phosphate oxidase superfamily flavin-nucleotide-binding protein